MLYSAGGPLLHLHHHHTLFFLTSLLLATIQASGVSCRYPFYSIHFLIGHV